MKDAGSVQRTGDLLVSVSRRSLGGLRFFFFYRNNKISASEPFFFFCKENYNN